MPRKNKKKVKKSAKKKCEQNDAASPSFSLSNYNVRYLETPVKSHSDKNEYRVILLSNGLRVALVDSTMCDLPKGDWDISEKVEKIQDDYAKDFTEVYNYCEEEGCVAVCYLCTNVGIFNNPKKLSGVSTILANTFRNPLYGAKPQMVEEHRDLKLQAIEAWEETLFGFRTSFDTFYSALDTFAQQFIVSSPKRSHVEEERDALAKYYGRPPSQCIGIQGEMSTFDNLTVENHPVRIVDSCYRKILCPVTTDELYKEILTFVKRHYNANRMTVVLKAELPLDDLEEYAIEILSKIPNNGLPPPNFEPHNFANSFDDTKFRRIWIIPNDSQGVSGNKMDVHWIMPPSRWLYKTKSLEYLAWILSHEGTGTLSDFLIKKNWAVSVTGDLRRENPWNTSLYSTFTISVALSKEGDNHKIEILDAIYSYINLMKRVGPLKRIYDEIRIVEELKFRDAKDVRDERLRLRAENMHLYEPADYITGPFLYYIYDPVSIKTCMELMAPMKGCIFVNNDNFGVSLKINPPSAERGLAGSIEIPEDWIKRWKIIKPFSELSLPKGNPFCPEESKITDTPKIYSKYPLLVHSDAIFDVWYKFEPAIEHSTCFIRLCYSSPLQFESVEKSVMFELFTEILQTLMHDELKPAKKAGFSYIVEKNFAGLFVYGYGFSQTLPLLMQTIVKYVGESRNLVTPELFEEEQKLMSQRYIKKSCNAASIADDVTRSILEPGSWTAMEKQNALRLINFDAFEKFLEQFTRRVHFKSLVQGNISEIDAIKIVREIVEMSACGPIDPHTMPTERRNQIPPGKHYCSIKAAEIVFSVQFMINYYQFNNCTLKRSVLIEALWILCTQPCFSLVHQLTAVATGVDRFFMGRETYCVDNFSLILRNFAFSDAMEPIDKRFFRSLMTNFTDEHWECVKEMMMDMKSEAVELFVNFQTNWSEIISGEYIFDRQSRELDILKNLEAKDFRDWMEKIIEDDSYVRKLRIVVSGYSTEMGNELVKKFAEDENSVEKLHPFHFNYPSETADQMEQSTYRYIADIRKFKNELESSLKNHVELNKKTKGYVNLRKKND